MWPVLVVSKSSKAIPGARSVILIGRIKTRQSCVGNWVILGDSLPTIGALEKGEETLRSLESVAKATRLV